jgi:peroxiredoxin
MSLIHFRQVLNGINDQYNKLFKDLNVRIIGISTDTHWTLGAYKNEKNIKFEMASDFNKDAAKAYGILIDKYSSYGYNGVAKEACFLIAFDK